MDIKNFLETVCQQIKYKPVRSTISEELEQHIQEIKEEYVEQGVQEKEAEEKAVKQMGEPEEIGKKLNKIHRPKLDIKLVILVGMLIVFGLFISILKQNQMNGGNVSKALIYISLGIGISIAVYFIDYKKINKFSNYIYLTATILLLLSILRFGYTINGTQILRIGSISFMPAVIAVPMYIMSFAGFITNYDKEKKLEIKTKEKTINIKKDLLKIITLTTFSLLLLIAIPSITNAIILGIIYLTMSTMQILEKGENKRKKLIMIYSIVTAIMLIMILLYIASPFKINRIITSFRPEVDPQGTGYIGMLQKEVLENAKLIGEAETEIMSDDMNILNNLSNYTFIYLIGKAGKLIASILVIIIVLTSIKLMLNAKNIKDTYGKYLIIGLSVSYIFQSIANILMNINLGIKADINLPFVTDGGVYFIVNIISIAIILSIYRRKNIDILVKN